MKEPYCNIQSGESDLNTLLNHMFSDLGSPKINWPWCRIYGCVWVYCTSMQWSCLPWSAVPPWCSWCVCCRTPGTLGLAGGLPPTCRCWACKQQWRAHIASAVSSGPPGCLLSPGSSAQFPVRIAHPTRSTSFLYQLGSCDTSQRIRWFVTANSAESTLPVAKSKLYQEL